MTEPNQSAFARISDEYIPEQWGLTKREYFAVHAEIPWNAVIETLMIKYPEKKGKISMLDVFEYQATAKVQAADALIEALNRKS